MMAGAGGRLGVNVLKSGGIVNRSYRRPGWGIRGRGWPGFNAAFRRGGCGVGAARLGARHREESHRNGGYNGV